MAYKTLPPSRKELAVRESSEFVKRTILSSTRKVQFSHNSQWLTFCLPCSPDWFPGIRTSAQWISKFCMQNNSTRMVWTVENWRRCSNLQITWFPLRFHSILTTIAIMTHPRGIGVPLARKGTRGRTIFYPHSFSSALCSCFHCFRSPLTQENFSMATYGAAKTVSQRWLKMEVGNHIIIAMAGVLFFSILQRLSLSFLTCRLSLFSWHLVLQLGFALSSAQGWCSSTPTACESSPFLPIQRRQRFVHKHH